MAWGKDSVDFSSLLGKTFTSIEIDEAEDVITFVTADGEIYKQLHRRDCCESVFIEDIAGSIEDLIGAPILLAEEVFQHGDGGQGSETWTFYKLGTIKGSVTIRWYGTSNGYYSETVELFL